MFANQYAYGKTCCLLSVTEKESINAWQRTGSLKKAYDKSVKGYVYILDAQARWTAPGTRKALGLVQPCIVLQLKVMDKKTFHFEVTCTDTTRKKRRLIFYGAQYYLYSKDNIHR
jgi:type IV secretory pathway VirB9-like protein